MARLAARGSSYPAVVTATIAAIFSVWTLYALSGAGVIRRLPFLRLVLSVIAATFLARGVLGVPVVLLVDDPYTLQLRDRMTFMIVSSTISTLLGLCYAVGAAALRQQSAPDSTLHRTPTRAA